MYAALSLALACAALALLSLAMNRHHEQAFSRRPQLLRVRGFRSAGVLSLVTSLVAAIAAQGWGTGPVLWLGLLSVAALLVVLLLPYRPRAVPRLAVFSLASAPVLLLMSLLQVTA